LNVVDERPPGILETEENLLGRLARLVEQGEIRLEIDRTKLTSLDFPLLVEAEGNRWAYGAIAATILGGWLLGPVAAILILAAALVGYFRIGRTRIARRLERRIRSRGLREVEIWRRLWRFGGVVLIYREEHRRQGPGQSWMELVRREQSIKL
jgi:hypothetical protein